MNAFDTIKHDISTLKFKFIYRYNIISLELSKLGKKFIFVIVLLIIVGALATCFTCC